MHTVSVHLDDVTAQREGVRHQKILRVKPYLDRHTYAEAFCVAFWLRVLYTRLGRRLTARPRFRLRLCTGIPAFVAVTLCDMPYKTQQGLPKPEQVLPGLSRDTTGLDALNDEDGCRFSVSGQPIGLHGLPFRHGSLGAAR